jgi:hypothetical protein
VIEDDLPAPMQVEAVPLQVRYVDLERELEEQAERMGVPPLIQVGVQFVAPTPPRLLARPRRASAHVARQRNQSALAVLENELEFVEKS